MPQSKSKSRPKSNANASAKSPPLTAGGFPEFEAHLPDPAAESAMRLLRPPVDRSAQRTQPRALARAVATDAVGVDVGDAADLLPRTAADYPHVIARLALCWHDPKALAQALDGLLFTDRTDRAGFPLPVISELTEAVRTRLAYLRLAAE